MSERSLIKVGDKEIKITLDNSHIGIDLPSNETVVIDNTNQSTQISPFGILNEERIEYTSVKETNLHSLNIPKEDFWLSLYGLWSCQSDTDQIPVTVKSVQNYLDYLLQTGLGYYSPVDTSVIILNRQSFWQGAGAPLEYHWLRSPVPSADFSPISNFPYIQSFTRDTHVLQLHPLRPPKPTPGTKFYERFIPAVGQTISFVHIDGSNSEHFEAYKRWQNSDRVNVGWRERGPDEKHHQYIKDRLADKHMMGFVFCWDGDLAGYGELAWVKEDPINTYCGGMNDYDQGKVSLTIYIYITDVVNNVIQVFIYLSVRSVLEVVKDVCF